MPRLSPADKQMLFEDVLKIFALSKSEREQLGEYGRKIVKKYYSVQKMAEDNILYIMRQFEAITTMP